MKWTKEIPTREGYYWVRGVFTSWVDPKTGERQAPIETTVMVLHAYGWDSLGWDGGWSPDGDFWFLPLPIPEPPQ